MTQTRLSATLHRRGGITMSVEVPNPLPDAIVRPAELSALDGPPGTPTGKFGERLFRRRSSDDGSIHYIQDHYLPEPDEATSTPSPARCTSCGRARSTFFVRTLARTDNLVASTARLCSECYPLHVAS